MHPVASGPERERIVDQVFAARHPGAKRRWELSALVVTSVYAAVFLGLPQLAAPSLGDWAAALAARVHAELDREQEVAIEPPPPPPPQQSAPPPPATAPAPQAGAPRRRVASLPAPAQTARVISRSPSTEPLDFTGSTFVVGNAASYAGGASTLTGTSAHSVTASPTAATGHADGTGRRRSVSLEESAWSCPWPAEAEGAEVVQETVVLRVSVRLDGTTDAVKVLSDPGLGFGQAARACALRTRFRPALDDSGAPVSEWSPPIRVRFVR